MGKKAAGGNGKCVVFLFVFMIWSTSEMENNSKWRPTSCLEHWTLGGRWLWSTNSKEDKESLLWVSFFYLLFVTVIVISFLLICMWIVFLMSRPRSCCAQPTWASKLSTCTTTDFITFLANMRTHKDFCQLGCTKDVQRQMCTMQLLALKVKRTIPWLCAAFMKNRFAGDFS